MAHLTINVPEELVDDLRHELQRTLLERAAAVRRALDAYLETRAHLDDVEGAVVELRDVDHALAQLPAAAITAHPEVLADALGALLRAHPQDPALRELVDTVEWGSC